MQDLGTLGGADSWGLGINNAGQVVGYSTPKGRVTTQAFLYSNGMMQDLGTLGGSWSQGMGINDAGQVVGNSQTAEGNYRAFVYNNGLMQSLGTLGGTNSAGYTINNAGQVVGDSQTAGDADSRAFLYSNGVMQDLNALIPANSGWFLDGAFGINDVGQVTGFGIFNGQQQAFLATPVPLPSAVGLLMTGLAVFGAAGRTLSARD